MDNVILNKIATIERCLKRIDEEYKGHEDELEYNYTRQDSIILNLQRACEASIDLCMRVIRMEKLGVPQSSRDAFAFLEAQKLIPASLSENLQKMVGFRNIAIHDYQKVNLAILKSIINSRLTDFKSLIDIMRKKI